MNQIEREYRDALGEVRFSDGAKERMLNNLMTQQEQAPAKRRSLHPLRTGLIAACLCLALVGTAVAASPGLRELLAEALGGFAPYAQELEGVSCVANGVELRVVSALADRSMIKVYAELRDLEGDRLSAGLQLDGMLMREREHWDDGEIHFGVFSFGCECVGYDEETGTALLEFTSWGDVPDDLTGVGLTVLWIAPTGWHWEYLNDLPAPAPGEPDVQPARMPDDLISGENWNLSMDVELVDSIAVPMEDGGLGLLEADLSTLGVTLQAVQADTHSMIYGLYSSELSVHLKDATVLALGNCAGKGSRDEVSIITWAFHEPVDPAEIAALEIDGKLFPLDKA